MDVYEIACRYRHAIEVAVKTGMFKYDSDGFRNFPVNCEYETCCILAHFLRQYGIETEYVRATSYDEKGKPTHHYMWLRMEDGRIIDITGDQFKDDERFLNYDVSVYVGEPDEFHNLFEVLSVEIKKSKSLGDLGPITWSRLVCMYGSILKYAWR